MPREKVEKSHKEEERISENKQKYISEVFLFDYCFHDYLINKCAERGKLFCNLIILLLPSNDMHCIISGDLK